MLVVLEDCVHVIGSESISVSSAVFRRLVAADLDAAKQCIPEGARASICIGCMNRLLEDREQEPSLLEDAEKVLEWTGE